MFRSLQNIVYKIITRFDFCKTKNISVSVILTVFVFLLSEYLSRTRVSSHVSEENKRMINRRCLSTSVYYVDRIHFSRVDHNIDKNISLSEKSSQLSLLSCRVVYVYKQKKTKTKTKRRLCDDVMRTFNSAEYRDINRFVVSIAYRQFSC